jgi:hypothetical protein
LSPGSWVVSCVCSWIFHHLCSGVPSNFWIPNSGNQLWKNVVVFLWQLRHWVPFCLFSTKGHARISLQKQRNYKV